MGDIVVYLLCVFWQGKKYENFWFNIWYVEKLFKSLGYVFNLINLRKVLQYLF